MILFPTAAIFFWARYAETSGERNSAAKTSSMAIVLPFGNTRSRRSLDKASAMLTVSVSALDSLSQFP